MKMSGYLGVVVFAFGLFTVWKPAQVWRFGQTLNSSLGIERDEPYDWLGVRIGAIVFIIMSIIIMIAWL